MSGEALFYKMKVSCGLNMPARILLEGEKIPWQGKKVPLQHISPLENCQTLGSKGQHITPLKNCQTLGSKGQHNSLPTP